MMSYFSISWKHMSFGVLVALVYVVRYLKGTESEKSEHGLRTVALIGGVSVFNGQSWSPKTTVWNDEFH